MVRVNVKELYPQLEDRNYKTFFKKCKIQVCRKG